MRKKCSSSQSKWSSRKLPKSRIRHLGLSSACFLARSERVLRAPPPWLRAQKQWQKVRPKGRLFFLAYPPPLVFFVPRRAKRHMVATWCTILQKKEVKLALTRQRSRICKINIAIAVSRARSPQASWSLARPPSAVRLRSATALADPHLTRRTRRPDLI